MAKKPCPDCEQLRHDINIIHSVLSDENVRLREAIERVLAADDDQAFTCEADGRPALEELRTVFNQPTAPKGYSCVVRLLGSVDGHETCAYLRDGTKIVVARDEKTKGPAWLEHKPQAKIGVRG